MEKVKSSNFFTSIFPSKHPTKKLVLHSDWKILYFTILVLPLFCTLLSFLRIAMFTLKNVTISYYIDFLL